MTTAFTYGDDGEVLVETSTGWTIQCLPVAAQYQRVGETVIDPTRPEPPTYTVTDAAGETVTFPHDAKSIQDPKTTDEDRARWKEYEDAMVVYEFERGEAERERARMRTNFIALKGVKVRGELPDLEAWAAEQRALFGVDVQASGPELLREWIYAEVLCGIEDGWNVVAGIFRASGLDEAAIDAAEATFRRSLGRAGGTDAGGDTEATEADQ